MQFFSGYSLREEVAFFDPFLKHTSYNVAGFSYGAIRALQFTLEATTRIETLQLFSPAYFCHRSESFKRQQLRGYRVDPSGYLSRFIEHCFAPYMAQEVVITNDGPEALETLLYFDWPPAALQAVRERGVAIEVYLGGRDAIVDAEAARAFFTAFATVHYLKNANHFLQGV